MAEAYKRRQLLLRKEDGSPGGFVRVEQAGSRATVEVRADGVPGEAKIMLLRPDGGEPFSLGILTKGVGTFPLSAAEADFSQAAVVKGDKLLLTGGEGADFIAVRKRLSKPVFAPKPTAKPVWEPPPASESYAAPGPVRQVEQVFEQAPAPPPFQAAPMETGWVFTPVAMPGAPEVVVGHLKENGRTKAVLHGVMGVYAPEPPPGLEGFVWDTGYWVRVEGMEA